MDCKREKSNFIEDREFLSRQLIKLGDMISGGLHHETDGKWISREYRRVAKALGYEMPGKKRNNNSEAINKSMAERLEQVACSKCSGALKQTRSGSVRAKCTQCEAKFQLLKINRKPS